MNVKTYLLRKLPQFRLTLEWRNKVVLLTNKNQVIEVHSIKANTIKDATEKMTSIEDELCRVAD